MFKLYIIYVFKNIISLKLFCTKLQSNFPLTVHPVVFNSIFMSCLFTYDKSQLTKWQLSYHRTVTDLWSGYIVNSIVLYSALWVFSKVTYRISVSVGKYQKQRDSMHYNDIKQQMLKESGTLWRCITTSHTGKAVKEFPMSQPECSHKQQERFDHILLKTMNVWNEICLCFCAVTVLLCFVYLVTVDFWDLMVL